ncbi:MAG: tetratricopeptide repeat protein, partial [Bryobacteraceae bacterium]
MLAGLLLLLFAQADPGERAARAKDLIGSGRFAEAAVIYAGLAKEMPSTAGLWMNLGMAEHMAGRDAEAVRALEQAVKLDPALPPSHLFLGLAYFRLGRPERAIAPLERFVTAQPDHRDARQALADALMMTRRWEPAAAHFQRLTEIDPSASRAFYGLGRAWEAVAAGAYDSIPAESAWRDVLAGSARAGVRRFPESLALYRRALSRNPKLRGVRAAIAEIYQETGHPNWAAEEEKREKAIPPADCKTERLECSFRGGRYRETIAAARPLKTAEAFYWTARSADELAAAAFARLE